MTPAILFLATILTAPVFAAELAPRTNPNAPATAWVNGHWYQNDGDGIRFVKGERFAAQGVFTAERPAEVAATVDLEGAFVVPPFGEAHNHNVDGPRTAGTAKRYLKQGIFYLKNPNNVARIAASGAELFNGPGKLDAIFAHGGLSIDEGHPEKLYRNLAPFFSLDPEKLDGVAFFDVPTIAALESRWPEVLAGRPDFIKLYLLNAAQEGNKVSGGLAPEVFRRAIELADEAGLRTTAHVETAADLALAVDAGADESAHLPGYAIRYGLDADAYRISEDLAQKIAKRGMIVITTTIVTEGAAQSNEKIAARKAEIQALQVENLKRLHGAGAALAIGSDSYFQTALDEARHLESLGAFSDVELLRLWVETGPTSIFPERAIGRLASGYEASFVALACDPTADFSCVEKINLRVKQGATLDLPDN